MNIRRAALIAEIVGGLGVIVSLLFVGLQVRSNAAAQEAQAVLDLRLAMTQVQRDLTTTSDMSEFVYRGLLDYDTLSDAELFRFRQWIGNVLNTYAIAYEYGRLERVSAAEFASWGRGICSVLSFPGALKVYEDWTMIGGDFRTWVSSSCPDLGDTE